MSIPMGHLVFGHCYYRLFYRQFHILAPMYVNPFMWTWLLSGISFAFSRVTVCQSLRGAYLDMAFTTISFSFSSVMVCQSDANLFGHGFYRLFRFHLLVSPYVNPYGALIWTRLLRLFRFHFLASRYVNHYGALIIWTWHLSSTISFSFSSVADAYF